MQSFDANKPAAPRSRARALPPEDALGPAIVAGGIGQDISPVDPVRVRYPSTDTIVDFASPFQAGALEPACPYDSGICSYRMESKPPQAIRFGPRVWGGDDVLWRVLRRRSVAIRSRMSADEG